MCRCPFFGRPQMPRATAVQHSNRKHRAAHHVVNRRQPFSTQSYGRSSAGRWQTY